MKVRLINRVVGTTVQMFPVCGKSGKLYGHAPMQAARGGPVFEMSLEDYERDKFDIIGNDRFQQQWIPEFVEDEPENPLVQQFQEQIGSMVKQPELPATTIMYRLRALIDRAKKARVFKKGMTEAQIKTALGY